MSEQLKEPMLINTGDVDNPTPVSQAMLDGYAPGSELYTYPQFPEVKHEELLELKDADYSTVFYKITKKLLGSALPDEILRSTAEEAYSIDNFDLDDDSNLRFTTLPSGIHIVGLSDGPTGAFKDMAMQPFARWMSYLQAEKGEPLTILLSTSGDTGPAALNAFAGLGNTEIIGMLPREGVSSFQRAQMAELSELGGVHVLEVEGSFSDLNDLQMEAGKKYKLSTVNSVNISRIIAQIPYYVASYLKAIRLEGKEVGAPVDISVPSGNFGNALSAIIARKMGVPIRNIIVATNENNTLDQLIRTGVFQLSEFQHTDSSAQDIKMPSNVWRYFSMLFNNDTEKITQVFNTLEEEGAVKIGEIGIDDSSVIEGVKSATIYKDDRAHAITDIYEGSGNEIIIDPHTANGVAAIHKLGTKEPGVPMLSMETAKPFKFNEAMMRIIGVQPPRPKRFEGLEQKQRDKKLVQIANEVELLTYLGKHTQAKSNN